MWDDLALPKSSHHQEHACVQSVVDKLSSLMCLQLHRRIRRVGVGGPPLREASVEVRMLTAESMDDLQAMRHLLTLTNRRQLNMDGQTWDKVIAC